MTGPVAPPPAAPARVLLLDEVDGTTVAIECAAVECVAGVGVYYVPGDEPTVHLAPWHLVVEVWWHR